MYEVYVIATRPFVEKITDDKFYPFGDEARVECDRLNSEYEGSPFHVYKAFIKVEKDEQI
jgi:hypothetical protein